LNTLLSLLVVAVGKQVQTQMAVVAVRVATAQELAYLLLLEVTTQLR
jgi:hypothetical protein